MKIEKIFDGEEFIGVIQTVAPSNINKQNTTMKIVSILDAEAKEYFSDFVLFEYKFEEWRLAVNHCFLSLESKYIDLFASGIYLKENVTLDEFIELLIAFRKR